MNRVLEALRTNPWVQFAVLFLLIIPSFALLVRPGFFPMQDDLQAFRLYEMDQCFKDWQIPCRWVPDAGYGYGYPYFNYYSPSVYYAGELFHLGGMQFIDVVKLLFVLGFIAGAFAMFAFVREWLGSWPAFVGAILYTYIPYKATEVYVRGSLSEFFALAFFPLIFWFIWRTIKQTTCLNITCLSLSVAGLLLTHNLMSFLFLPIATIWTLFWLLQIKNWSAVKLLAMAVFLGLGIASFFVLPLVFEKQYAHLETLLGGYFDYRQHFVSVRQLFFSNHFGYGSDYMGTTNDDVSLGVGVLQLVMSLLAGVLSLLAIRKKNVLAMVVFVLLGVQLVIAFLMHEKSSFIWQLITPLSWLQFPWRFLGPSAFLMALLSALAVALVPSKKLLPILGLFSIVTAFLLYGSFYQPKSWLAISDADKFSGQSWQTQLTTSIFDYLPIYAEKPPRYKAPDLPEILDGQATVTQYQKGSNYQRGTIRAETPAAVRIPLYDFPGMQVWLNDKLIKHYHNDCRYQQECLGLINFVVPSGTHTMLIKLTNTPIRTAGNVISLISLVILVFGIIYAKKNRSLH